MSNTLHMSQLLTDNQKEQKIIEFLCDEDNSDIDDLEPVFLFLNTMSPAQSLTIKEAIAHFGISFLYELINSNTAWDVWYKNNHIVKRGFTV